MFDKFTKPRFHEERKPSYYFKSMVAGFFASTAYALENFDLLAKFNLQKQVESFDTIFKEKPLTLNGSMYKLLSGTVRFGFYEIFKSTIDKVLGEKLSKQLRYFNWMVSAAGAEFLAVVASIPFQNVQIFNETILQLDDIERIRANPKDTQLLAKLFPRESRSDGVKNYYQNIKLKLCTNVPFTAFTFTAFELFAEIIYDYGFQESKSSLSGLRQLLVSATAGSLAGVSYFLVGDHISRLFNSPQVFRHPSSLQYYAMMGATQFTVYNAFKLLMQTETMGGGTSQAH